MNIVKVTKGITAALLLSCAALVTGQTGSPLLQPRQFFPDRNGQACVQCKLYSYAAGTTTLQATYTDSTLGTPNPNPTTLDSSGSANIWLGSAAYKFVLTNPAGATIWTVDNVPGSTAGAYLGVAGGAQTGGTWNSKNLDGRLTAPQWCSPSNCASNNGIAMSLAECNSLPYACSILAPALYAQTEQLNGEWWNYQNGQTFQYGNSQSFLLEDRRLGNYGLTIANPFTLIPTSANTYSGFNVNTFWGPQASPLTVYRNFEGADISATHFGGGLQNITYGSQSSLVGAVIKSTRYTAEGSTGLSAYARGLGPGDVVTQGWTLDCLAGYVNKQDEGCEYLSTAGGEEPWEYRGTVSSVSGTTLVVNPATPASGETIAGSQGDGRYMAVTSTGVVNATPSALTDFAAQLFSSTYGYFSSMTFASVPTSTAYGTISTPISLQSTQTVTFSLTGGSLVTGLACVADQPTAVNATPDGKFELITITNVSGSSATAYFAKQHPAGTTIWQGGYCGRFLEIVADTIPIGTVWSSGQGNFTLAAPVRYFYPILGSTDGTHLYFFSGSNIFGNGRGIGSQWSRATNKAVNIYHGAEVYSVAGPNGDLCAYATHSQCTNQNTDPNQFTLSPNDGTFAASATVEEGHMYVQAVSVGQFNLNNYSPHGYWGGLTVALGGQPQGGNDNPAFNAANSLHSSSYVPWGGKLITPDHGFRCFGPWIDCFDVNPGPGNSDPVTVINMGTVSTNTPQVIATPFAGSDSAGNAYTAPDKFEYTPDAGFNMSGGTWGFLGNFAVTGGNISTNGNILGNIPSIYTADNFASGTGYNYNAYSSNLGGSSWGCFTGNATVTTGQTDPWGGTSASKVVTTAIGEFCDQAPTTNLTASTNYAGSVWLKGAAGGETVCIGAGGGSCTNAILTTSWVRYTWTQNSLTTNLNYTVVLSFLSGQTWYVYNAVTEPGTSSNSTILNTGNTQTTTPTGFTSSRGSAICLANGTNCPSAGAVVQRISLTSGICTTTTTAYNSCTQTITWPVAFADTGYSATCTGAPPTSGLFFVLYVSGKTTSGATVTLQNGDASGAAATTTSEIDCIGVHP